MADRAPRKLSLFDAVGMAVGGMVGGGIFAVLGQATTTAGNGAFLAFGLAGVLALVTGVSYARLTTSYDEPGGSFSYVEELAGKAAAGTVAWFLLVGYLFTNALYAYTFGAYGARLVGLGEGWTPVLGTGIVTGLAAVNVAGVETSAKVEDAVVYTKVVILVALGVMGCFAVDGTQALPVFERSTQDVVVAAALIFVGYEGFQLLTYDYDDLADHERNLPRALWISIPFVTLLYMGIAFVVTGSLDPSTILAREETVLAEVARPIMGRVGLVLVLVAAVLSTASAINATLFATGRLARRIARDGELPSVLTSHTVNRVPVPFLTLQVSLSVLLLFTADLEQIVTFSSLVFLLVFAVVNVAAVWHRVFPTRLLLVPLLGALGCLAAFWTLSAHTARQDPRALMVIGGVAGLLLVLRMVFIGVRRWTT